LKRAGFSIFIVFGLLLGTGFLERGEAHDTLEGKKIRFAPDCSLSGESSPCVIYTVTKDDRAAGLSGIAARYSTKEWRLTVKMLLAMRGNEYLRSRPVPARLAGYYGPPWNRKSYDWIFPGDKIVLPLVFVEDEERGISSTESIPNNTGTPQTRNYFWPFVIVLVYALFLTVFILIRWRDSRHDDDDDGGDRDGDSRQ